MQGQVKNRLVLVIQQIMCEGLGAFGAILGDMGIGYRVAEMERGDRIPDIDDYRALIVMGGPMSVYDEQDYPFLQAEDFIIRTAVRTGVPFLGICLGGQLLAKALGARVRRNKVKEIGFREVALTGPGKCDPLFASLEDKMAVFQWHGDTFAIPRGGSRLATAPTCTNQAFLYGKNAYGLQFHIETTADMIREWAKVYRRELVAERIAESTVVTVDLERQCAAMHASAKVLLSNFLSLPHP
ncbi:MAG: type 1 glutamine amidotransferase [Dehalococcoidia bacterium]|nr:type 1 glutamine amidotransferase [Dehalococcoidia bacterium]